MGILDCNMWYNGAESGLTDLLSSVMSSAVHGMPRVMSDSELTTGLTKASPVVIPDKMPMTTLNRDLDGEAKQVRKTESAATQLCMDDIVKYRKNVGMTQEGL